MDGKQLKNSILQWAIQGKLVPQNPKDEPAQKLLERIAASRNESSLSLSKGTSSTSLRGPCKGTKQSKNPTSRIYRENGVWYEQVGAAAPKDISDEIPFEIPENWVWSRLKNIVYNHGQKTPIEPFSYIDIGSIDNKHQKLNDKENIIQASAAPSRARKIVEINDILYSTVRPYLHNMCVIDRDFSKEPIASTGFAVMACYECMIVKFLFYYLMSPEFDDYANDGDNAKGIAYPAINDEKLYKALIPIPPLAEQKRIVAKLEQVLPLAEEYGAAQEQLDKLNKELPEALKKSILQEAIQGKLVPQKPKDEPAQKLLERIAASRNESSLSLPKGTSSTSLRGAKATKQSKNPPSHIYRENGVWYEQIGTATPKDISDEIPFEIPETWAWCRFNSICDIARGGSPRPIQNYLTDSPEGYNWIKIGDTEKGGKYINSTKERIKPEGLTKTRLIHKGDFLLTNSMSFGRPYISNIDGCIHDGWLVMSILGNAFVPDYLYYLLSSPYAYHQFCGRVAGAVVKNLNIDKVAESLIPLPPLAEQKRIVDKLEQLFKVL